MKNNNLIEMQKMLLNQMERLNKGNIKKEEIKTEIARGNAMSQTATAFLKSVNLGIRIIETSEKYKLQKDKLSKELGVEK